MSLALHAWPLLLSVALCWPLLTSRGYPLARDLVFVPRQPLTEASLGLGDTAPRAVPLDSVIGVLTFVVDGGVLARFVLPLSVALAGWGMLRLLSGVGWAPRVAASGLAVWNPFVVERLALGQWALVLGYGALPWIVIAAHRYCRDGGSRHVGRALAWTALASLTPTGGVLAMAALIASGVARTRRSALLLVGGAVLQLPWVCAALVGAVGLTTDPDGVAAFAPDTAASSGPLVALVGLGGIWDDASEPATRGTWLSVLAAVVTCLILLAGWSWLCRRFGVAAMRRVATAVLLSALVSVLGATPTGQDVLRSAAASVPGAGLLRDSQKYVGPLALLVAAAFGAVVARVQEWFGPDRSPEGHQVAVMSLIALPFLLLPDAVTVTWPTLTPVRYPDSIERAVATLDARPDSSAVAVLPWRSYRLFSWGSGLTSSDPLTRWSGSRILVSDDLQVGTTLVSGESRLASEVTSALATGPPAQVLGELGVGRVVLYRDDPDAGDVDLTGLTPVLVTAEIAVFDVPGVKPTEEMSPGGVWVVLGAHLGYAMAALGSLGAAWSRGRPRGSEGERQERRTRVR